MTNGHGVAFPVVSVLRPSSHTSPFSVIPRVCLPFPSPPPALSLSTLRRVGLVFYYTVVIVMIVIYIPAVLQSFHFCSRSPRKSRGYGSLGPLPPVPETHPRGLGWPTNSGRFCSVSHYQSIWTFYCLLVTHRSCYNAFFFHRSQSCSAPFYTKEKSVPHYSLLTVCC